MIKIFDMLELKNIVSVTDEDSELLGFFTIIGAVLGIEPEVIEGYFS